MGEYTIERLQSLDDLGEVLELGEEWGVDFKGLETDESFKERLILHKLKQNNEQYFKMDEVGLQGINEEHEKKTRAIIELFEKVRTSLGSSFTPISSILKAGNTSDDLNEDFNRHISDLQQRECCIVFAGETSAGKSSLLNLILGIDILPTHNNSCTFAICKLKYSKKYKCKIIYADGQDMLAEYDNFTEASKALKPIVFERNHLNRQNVSSVKEIEIYLPADILKSGITIVDTPGFGEHSDLDSMVTEFFSSNSITGFVYLIRTDSAGGVQEDRLLEFLRKIRLHRRKASISDSPETIDTKAAMFICNRWDIIREDQREKVRRNAISKLSDALPGLKESQVTFFSTDAAAKHANVDTDYITKEFAALLTNIVALSQTALDTKITQHYRWLKLIHQQTTSHVISMLSQINKSDEELYQKFKETKKRLDILRLHSRTTVTDIHKIIADETDIIQSKIKTYIHPDNTQLKAAIEKWDLDENYAYRKGSMVSLSCSVNRGQSFNSYDSMALRNLVDEIDKWIKSNKYDEQMITKVEDLVHNRLEGLQSKINAINCEMRDNNSLSSSSSCSTLAEDELVDLLSSVHTMRHKSFKRKLVDISEGETKRSILLQPKVLIARAMLSVMQKRRSSIIDSNPTIYIKERAIRFMAVFYNDETLIKKMATRYTENLLQYAETIEANIPRFISTNQELMTEINSSREMKVENKGNLMRTSNHLDEVRELLRGFECVYIKKLKAQSIKFPNQGNEVLRRLSSESIESSLIKSGGHHISHYICFYTQLGLASFNGVETNIVSRTSNGDVAEENVFKETSRLMHVKHHNIAAFIGMVNYERRPVFVFSGELRPLNRYLMKLHVADIKSLICKLICGIIHGLSALHNAGLVHMELSPKTIMIESETEEVKLIGGCLPRTINFPEHNDTTPVGYLTYFSSDVLRGKIYSSEDDIYSLGLVIWELMFHEDPFHKQSSMGQTEFINTVNPSEMVVLKDEWPQELKALFTGCLFTNPSERLTVSAVRSCLDSCDIIPLILDRKPSRRKAVSRFFRGSSKSEKSLFNSEKKMSEICFK